MLSCSVYRINRYNTPLLLTYDIVVRYTPEAAEAAIASGDADLIAIGKRETIAVDKTIDLRMLSHISRMSAQQDVLSSRTQTSLNASLTTGHWRPPQRCRRGTEAEVRPSS